MEQWLFLLAGVFVGGIGIWFLLNRKQSELDTQISHQKTQLDALRQKGEDQKVALTESAKTLEQYRQLAEDRGYRIATLESENNHLEQLTKDKKTEMEQLQKQLSGEFENIANRILTKRSKEMSENQNQRLTDVLAPFKERIASFEQKVSETYEKELRDKLNLQAEVKRLYELNQRISEEAGNLTKALKGDVKKMGNWGELILERILEQSGLTKGREYDREVAMTNGEGIAIRPDVIINLPDQKHLIIDSKLSLVAYERYVNATSEEEQKVALKAHLESMRTHIRTLHDKSYATAKALNTPDFVLMFVPVEASFAAAVEGDSELFGFAWDRKIVPVSPSTLLATLRTISSIWRQENQNKNALEIARQSGTLYDKLVGFVNDLDKVGKSLEAVHGHYGNAMNKLSQGRGNLISKAEKIKELGAKSSKNMPAQFAQTDTDAIEQTEGL